MIYKLSNKFVLSAMCFMFLFHLFMSCTSSKRETKESICFLDIPLSGEVNDFAGSLEKKGFIKDTKFDGILNSKMHGKLNNEPCDLIIGHSMTGEVVSVIVKFQRNYDILKTDNKTNEEYVDMDVSDSLKVNFDIHKKYIEKMYSVELNEGLQNDTVKILPHYHEKWLNNGFVFISPNYVNGKYCIVITLRGNSQNDISNKSEFKEFGE